jgi:hypothetical protein
MSATMLMPSIEPCGSSEIRKFDDDPMSAPKRLLLCHIRPLTPVENSYENPATLKAGICKAKRILAHL